MHNLTTRIAAVRDIAIEREGDIRIKEFLRAITISQDGGAAEPINLEVACHFRSWQKHITHTGAAQLIELSRAELADAIARWVQDAINEDLLSLSDPPKAGQTREYSVGAVVTYIYGKDWTLVGKRWE